MQPRPILADRLHQKEAMRLADRLALEAGLKSSADLRCENHLLAKAGQVARRPDGSPLLRAIGRKPLVVLPTGA